MLKKAAGFSSVRLPPGHPKKRKNKTKTKKQLACVTKRFPKTEAKSISAAHKHNPGTLAGPGLSFENCQE